jgi:hypothetical protein
VVDPARHASLIGQLARTGLPILLVKFVTHAFGELFVLALGLCVFGVDHEILEMPKPPAQILELLTLLEGASDLGADLGEGLWHVARRVGEKTNLPCLG